MAKDIVMPVLGMNQETGTLVEWFKSEGDEVQKGEPLMLVATDKTEVEIEATASGILANVSVQPGDEVPVGSPIASILAPGEAAPPQTNRPATDLAEAEPKPEHIRVSGSGVPSASPVAARIAAEHNVDLATIRPLRDRIQKSDILAHIASRSQNKSAAGNRIPASPKARRLAREKGLDLSTVPGSGPEGAVLTADVLAVDLAPLHAADSTAQSSASITPMSRTWRVMAERLQQSWQSVPHFYLERQVDAKAILAWHKQARKRIRQKTTLTDFFIKVVASALRQHLRLNSSWIDEQIVENREIHVGLAVAVEEGLLVPVVHHADRLGIATIAERRADMVSRAQSGSLKLDEMQDGTFTVSNLGMYGVTKFNAIVNPPQAAILAVGGVEERAVPVKGKLRIRPSLTLTLSCDHRIVDGAQAAQFMQTLVGYLMQPLSLLD